MKLKYKVLWIEDQMKSIRGKYRVITKYIEDEKGFEADIKHIETFEEFESDIGYDALKDYDLLLVDLNLDEEDEEDENDGNKIISNIRGKNIYTEIVFYSSQYEDLQNKLKEHFIEGIFTSERKLLETKAKSIIDVTLHKVQDTNNLRGLIMAEVAELDRLKKSILLKYNEKHGENLLLKKYIKEDVFGKVNEELEDLACIINPGCEHSEIDFEKLLNNFFYDSYKKSRTVNKVKKLEASCSAIPFVHQDYYNNIIKKRNVFAHEEEKTRENGTKYLNYPDKTPLEFNEKHCIEIRKDIKRYKKLLEDIKTQI